MFSHNIKIAFRNILKYKNQTLISVMSLAVGFTCFALATLWIRYEMTFDSFHKNARQMYVVYTPSINITPGFYSSRQQPRPLAAYLKETFPEIADATPLMPASSGGIIIIEDIEFPALIISVDSSFLRMFDTKILEGSREFLITGSDKLAITQDKARQLFGNENPIGKTVNVFGVELTICAVVSGMPGQSNYPFDFIRSFRPMISGREWVSASPHTIIELHPGIDLKAFEKKLYEHNTGAERGNISRMTLTPLTKLRYTDPEIKREVKFQHIFVFAISGMLVVFCSLFNYLTLFISRFRIRQKELALRIVYGASGLSLLATLSVEFVLTLLFALVLGCVFTQLLHKPFLTLSDIQMNLSDIYIESLMYVGCVISVSLLMFWLILIIFRQRNLNLSIRRSNKKQLRKISVIVQLIISIGFAFCTIVILKQMYFLHNSGELGFSFKNRGSLFAGGENIEAFADILRQIPEIIEVVDARRLSNLIPLAARPIREIGTWDNNPTDLENISLESMFISPEYADFYDLRLVAGEMLNYADSESSVLINESAAIAFGWYDPVGKQFSDGRNTYTVKGVVKNVYNFAPTLYVNPVFYLKPPPNRVSLTYYGETETYEGRLILFKFHDGMWNSTIDKIEQMKDEFRMFEIYNAEEVYNNYLKSEKTLMKLLFFVSGICVLVCIFGFVSLVSLTCEERRKEIAIRKINGATVKDILAIFAIEYFLLLFIGATIAFSAGYLIMQRWLEHYVIQTSIPVWVYLSIIFVLALVIVLCVGWQVYKSSIENPAKLVKCE